MKEYKETEVDKIFGGIEGYKKMKYDFSSLLIESAKREEPCAKYTAKQVLAGASRINAARTKRKVIFIFLGYENLDLIEKLAEIFYLVVVNPSMRLQQYCLKNRIEFCFSRRGWTKTLIRYYEKKDNYRQVLNVIGEIESILSKKKCRMLLLPDDLEVLFRAYICVAKKLGISSATIQHGIITADSMLGMYTDQFWVWGNAYKKEYERNRKKKLDNIYAMGYPYPIDERITRGSEESQKVLLIGQPFEGTCWKNEMEQATRNVYGVCMDKGLELCYRLHPREQIEDLETVYSELENMNYSKESLTEDLRNYNIIIGMSSTVLLEAMVYKKHVIQIKSENMVVDYSKCGSAWLVENRYDSIEDTLEQILNKTYNMEEMDSGYIRINENYKEEVSERIQEMIDGKI